MDTACEALARAQIRTPVTGAAEDSVGESAAAAQRGDRVAFADLHRRFAPMVHAILLARVPAADADDLVQDVFVAALDRLSDLRDTPAFGAWLATIARNRAADFHRRAMRTVALPLELPAPEPPQNEDGARVLAAIRALPDAYRETLLMRLVEGMSGPEIARATGLTHGSVRVNLHRGMALLRERLQE